MSRPAAIFVFVLLLTAFFVYLAFRFQGFFMGSAVYIDFPKEGETLNNSHMSVEGKARNAAKLTLNGRPIYTDEEGRFEEDLILSAGLNIIEVKAEGRFGSEVKEQRMVMVKMPE